MHSFETHMIGKDISHYRILEKLGGGGMGVAYKAEDRRLQRTVVLKFLKPDLIRDEEAKSRFITEARAASALDHPNICTIYHIDEDDEGSLFICMAFCEHQTLREKLAAGPLDSDEALDLMIGVARGLAAAHADGITHRDLKPDNIGLSRDDTPRLLDFGLAKLADAIHQTRDDSIKGTFAYMAPEQIGGEPIDHRIDIWAMGAMLYELLTGQRPFAQDYGAAVLYAVVHEPHTPVRDLNPEVPETVAALIDRCLAKKADDRFQTADELREALETCRRPEAPLSIDLSSGPTTGSLRRLALPGTRALMVGVAGIAAVLLLAFNINPILGKLGWHPVPEEKHLLVLPFSNITGNAADAAFCNGLVEVLASQLTMLEQFQGQLMVIPASEVRGSGVSSAAEARQHFGATLVIGGSVQRGSEAIILTLNLIDARQLRNLTSAVLQTPPGNLVKLQEEVVTRVADMLRLRIQPRTRQLLTAGTTVSTPAYEDYLQGRGFLADYIDADKLDRAIELFRNALEQDPGYALAMAGLGEAYWRKYETTKDDQWAQAALDACENATAISERLAPVHATLGIIYRGTGQYDRAETAFRTALEIDPVNAEAWRGLAGTFTDRGDLDAAEATYRRAIELKPNYWAMYYDLGRLFYRQGKYSDAEAQYRQVIRLYPQNYRAFRNLGALFVLTDRTDEAVTMLERSLAINANYGAYSNLATLYYMKGLYGDAAATYEKALEINDRYYLLWGNLAYCYQLLPERRDEAPAAFRRAIALAEQQLQVNPRDGKVLSTLANYHASIDENDQSRALITRALELNPDDLDIRFKSAEIFQMLGEPERAREFVIDLIERGYSIEKLETTPVLDSLMTTPPVREALQKRQSMESSGRDSQ